MVPLRYRKGLNMLANSTILGFVPVLDFKRAKPFYEGTLGLKFRGEDPFALEFEAGQNRIRVVRVGKLAPQPFTILGWEVEDVSTTVAALAAKGVIFERFPGMDQDSSGIWKSPSGARIAWFKDPDGNVLSVSQHS